MVFEKFLDKIASYITLFVQKPKLLSYQFSFLLIKILFASSWMRNIQKRALFSKMKDN